MKKIIVAMLTVGAASLNAQAADTGPGCGVGAVIFDGQSGKAAHVLAATTNGTLGNQTFGMSTGSLGCENSNPIQSLAGVYVENNIERVAGDFSKGQGESFDTMVKLLKIKEQDVPAFSKVVRQNFSTIFPSENVTSDQVLENLAAVMRQDEDLSAYVI